LLLSMQVAGGLLGERSVQSWRCLKIALWVLKHGLPRSFWISQYIISCLLIVFQDILDRLYSFNLRSASWNLLYSLIFRLYWFGLSYNLTYRLTWLQYLLWRVNRLFFIQLRRFRFLAPYAEHCRFGCLLPLWRRRVPLYLFRRHFLLLAFLWRRIDFLCQCRLRLFLSGPWNRYELEVSSLRTHHPLHWPLRTSIHAILQDSDLLLYGRVWGRRGVRGSFPSEFGAPLRPLRLEVICA